MGLRLLRGIKGRGLLGGFVVDLAFWSFLAGFVVCLVLVFWSFGLLVFWPFLALLVVY